MSIKSHNPEKPILIVDDEPSWTHSLALSLKISAGINHVCICHDSREVMALLREDDYSLVLLDLNMPYVSGSSLLAEISEVYPEIPVIVISGMNQIATAINCIKGGATDFFVKTDDRERVVSGITKALKQRQLLQENRRLTEVLLQTDSEKNPAFAAIVTDNAKMRGIFSYLCAISQSSEPLLIVGESGTGKELIAQALHQLCCPEKSWVAVNVAGLDDLVFSDTLFGHVKGAYTGADKNRKGMVETAAGGILFLDEIGDLAPASQVKLLRLLQEGEFYPLGSDKPSKSTARIVTATNQDLTVRETEGTFRRDLLFRLCSHRVELPPLRERKEDIPPLLNLFLAEVSESLKKNKPAVPPELLTLLSTYSFPGNIRELRAMVFDAVSAHQGGVLSMQRFNAAIKTHSRQVDTTSASVTSSSSKVQFSDELPTLKELKQILTNEAMQRSQGNQSIAARMIGVTPQALSKRLK